MKDAENKIKGIMASKSQMEALLSKLGIVPTDFIVIYDAKGNPDASRLWWVLNYYGHKNKALLNGGLTAWKEKGQAVTDQKATPQASSYAFVGEPNTSLYASIEDVKVAMADTNYVIIDARTTEEYDGTEPIGTYKRVGHIPKSVSINYENNIDYAGKSMFKSVEELKALYKDIPPNKKIICYCKSGVRSSLTTYVLTEVLGYKNVQNYDGSWLEWNIHEELPFETAAKSKKG